MSNCKKFFKKILKTVVSAVSQDYNDQSQNCFLRKFFLTLFSFSGCSFQKINSVRMRNCILKSQFTRKKSIKRANNSSLEINYMTISTFTLVASSTTMTTLIVISSRSFGVSVVRTIIFTFWRSTPFAFSTLVS